MGEDTNKGQDTKEGYVTQDRMKGIFKRIIEKTSGISVELQDLVLGSLDDKSDKGIDK